MNVSKLRLVFELVCIIGIIYGMSIENEYGSGWAAVALITSLTNR